jgi:hypothetical protein
MGAARAEGISYAKSRLYKSATLRIKCFAAAQTLLSVHEFYPSQSRSGGINVIEAADFKRVRVCC